MDTAIYGLLPADRRSAKLNIMINNNHKIVSKNIINQDDYKKIAHLQNICSSYDNIFLKLELEFKMDNLSLFSGSSEHKSEFLYYIDDVLVGYAGMFSIGSMENAEITGMVHPDYRRQGIFTKIFSQVTKECGKRKLENILLLADNKSQSGNKFIQSVGGVYDTSEYQMELLKIKANGNDSSIILRPAQQQDLDELKRQDTLYFGVSGEESEDNKDKYVTYVIQLDEKIIGKIRVDYNDDIGFIYGFGILPDYRRKGYGRQSLIKTLEMIKSRGINKSALEVECKNASALNLYKSCGFVEKSVMNYYKYTIDYFK